MAISDLLESLLAEAMTWVPDAERNYVAHGRPAADCDSLVVWTETITATRPHKAVCQIESKWTVHVSRFKCVPTLDDNGNALPAQEYEDSALDLANEGEAIWYGAIGAWADGTLFDGAIGCTEIDFTQGLSVIEPQGGMGGWDLVLVVSLP
jgi:hypothetical protein